MQNKDPDGDPHPQYIILAIDGQHVRVRIAPD
jgi:hypothetical protein